MSNLKLVNIENNSRLCSKCMEEKPFNKFHKDKGGVGGYYCHCKECRKAISRKDYETRTEAIKESVSNYRKTDSGKRTRRNEYLSRMSRTPEKNKAVSAVNHAIRDKRLFKRNLCEICYDSPTECHHHDYSLPLDVIELCKRCHNYLHNYS